ncbi:MAG TPA: hypothetical protein VIB39_19830 [Candidatus Angelobacter sp.]|jgi:hypothetical protein
MIKTAINWLVFTGSTCYAAWMFLKMLGVLFVVGNNDTALGVLGILAIGFFPLPASFLAMRYRRVAAAIFLLASVLWTIGVFDSDSYIAAKFGNHTALKDEIAMVLGVAGFPLFLSIFYLSTDLPKWPLIAPRIAVQSQLEVKG